MSTYRANKLNQINYHDYYKNDVVTRKINFITLLIELARSAMYKMSCCARFLSRCLQILIKHIPNLTYCSTVYRFFKSVKKFSAFTTCATLEIKKVNQLPRLFYEQLQKEGDANCIAKQKFTFKTNHDKTSSMACK